jgi:hypothetical protein
VRQGPPGYRGTAASDERGDPEDPTVHTSPKLESPNPTDPMPPIEGPALLERHNLRLLPKMTPDERTAFGLEAPADPDEGPKPSP